MSIAVLMTTHGQAANELRKTAEMIIGEQENLTCLDFVPGENGDVLADKMRQALQGLETAKGVLFLVDLWGGTPFNASSAVVKDLPNAAIVAGVNVPMLIETLLAREDSDDLEELVKTALTAGAEGVKSPNASVSIATQAAPSQSAQQSSAPVEQFDENDPEIQRLRAEASSKVQDVPHMKFGLWRIDDRLIHGQVATRWTKETGVSRIIVVNDNVAKDEIRSNMLKQAVPPGVSAHVVSVDKMMRVYNNPEYADDTVMLLFTNPSDCYTLVERGVPIQSINVGGMAFKEGRTMLDLSVSVDAHDVEVFKKLVERGIEVEVRKVASDKKVQILDLIASKYKVS